jgi:hypothetical protein
MSAALEFAGEAPTVGDLDLLLVALAQPSPAATDAERIDRIAVMERLKGALAAAQARETVAFKTSQLAAQKAAGVPKRRWAAGIVAQLGLARRESPAKTERLVTLADVLDSQLPNTAAALTAGVLSEHRALIVVRETSELGPDDRREADRRIAAELPHLGDRELAAAARQQGYALDPVAHVRKHARAVSERRVSLRPAPEVMAQLSALLPAAQGVACWVALKKAAAGLRAGGDERSEGQLMADTLVERITGQTQAAATPVEVQLVMTDQTLLAADDEPARLTGYGPVPAPIARQLLRDLPAQTKTWIRRLYTSPDTGRISGIDGRRRRFTGRLRKLLIVRDEICRTLFCNGAIKHLDHVTPSADGGPTSQANGQGLCERCNYVKSEPGWKAEPDPDGGAGVSVTTTTPTGHSYISRPPPLPGRLRSSPVPHPTSWKPPWTMTFTWDYLTKRAA